VKAAYTLEGSGTTDKLLSYPFENPVWATAASAEGLVQRLGDNVGGTNISIRNYSNAQVAYVDSLGNASFKYIVGVSNGSTSESVVNKAYVDSVASSYNATYDAKPSSTYNATYDAKLGNPIFGYVTLMAGSAMVTTTNPTVMTQWETTTNKNNYISLNFTDGGTEVAQWIVDFPADWNRTANVIFTPVWTASSGTGTVKFDVAGKLFGDDAALDTALASIGTSTDTLLATGDLHVADPTTGAAISAVGTGNTAIIKVSRDSGTDTLSGTAELIGLRVKYVTNKA
jgi:hypothetical protein